MDSVAYLKIIYLDMLDMRNASTFFGTILRSGTTFWHSGVTDSLTEDSQTASASLGSVMGRRSVGSGTGKEEPLPSRGRSRAVDFDDKFYNK